MQPMSFCYNTAPLQFSTRMKKLTLLRKDKTYIAKCPIFVVLLCFVSLFKRQCVYMLALAKDKVYLGNC